MLSRYTLQCTKCTTPANRGRQAQAADKRELITQQKLYCNTAIHSPCFDGAQDFILPWEAIFRPTQRSLALPRPIQGALFRPHKSIVEYSFYQLLIKLIFLNYACSQFHSIELQNKFASKFSVSLYQIVVGPCECDITYCTLLYHFQFQKFLM